MFAAPTFRYLVHLELGFVYILFYVVRIPEPDKDISRHESQEANLSDGNVREVR